MFFETYYRLLDVGDYYQAKNCNLAASEITQIIRRQFSATDYSFSTLRSSEVSKDTICVSGFYDNGEIELVLYYNPQQRIFKSKNIDWQRLVFDVAEVLTHELIHDYQDRTKQKFKKYKSDQFDQSYLGDESEIDAYAFSICAESLVYNRHYKKCSMYQVYRKTFDKDRSVIVKLEKEILKYLNRLEQNND